MAAETLRHTVYNVSSGRPADNREFAEAVGADELPPASTGEVPHLDITRLAEETGFAPEFGVADAVADYLAWRADHVR